MGGALYVCPIQFWGLGVCLEWKAVYRFLGHCTPTVMLSDEHSCPLGVNLFKMQSLRAICPGPAELETQGSLQHSVFINTMDTVKIATLKT